MATTVPAPVLDTRDGAQITAQSIASLPAELSDRSDANAAVVIIEASGNQHDKALYQLNRWPSAVIQKVLNLVGITLLPATGGTVTQQFTLSAPQSSDTVIPKGSQVSTADGTIAYSTLSDLTIRAYITGTGTISLTAGSATVTGSGTAFTTQALAGYQISTDKATWYTVANVSGDTSLTLTTSAAATVTGSAFYSGSVSGTVSAQATTTGSSTTVAAAALTALSSPPAGVGSTTNPAASTAGTDTETTAAVIARAPTAFNGRDMATASSDVATFAQLMLGTGGRAISLGNVNVLSTTSASGYTSVGLLSPNWTTTTSVSSQERANVVRDLNQRVYSGATVVDVAAYLNTFTTAGAGASTGTMFAAAVYRKAAYDSTSTIIACAKAVNTYLSPNTYPWGRSIDPDDLAAQINPLVQIDRVATINGVLAVGMNYTVFSNNATFTSGSSTVTCNAGDSGSIVNGQSFLMDSTNNAVYLVTAGSGSTSLTITPAFAGATNTFKPGWFTSQVTKLGTSANSYGDSWYSLPYSSLSVSSSSPPASILVVGAV